MVQSYKIKIDKFEGPFDLLLFFIERDELDIYDIPISQITTDFLAYIKELESLNIDVASEFILVAATLMSIKAKMLIPRKELDSDGNEIDPRASLTQQLLEYRKYKEVIKELEKLEEDRSFRFERGLPGQEFNLLADKINADSEIESVTLYKLLQTFNKLMQRMAVSAKPIVHTIYQYNYTIEDQQKFIKSAIKLKGSIRFEDLFENIENKVQAVVTFLALLELLNLQSLILVQGEGLNNFWLQEKALDEEE